MTSARLAARTLRFLPLGGLEWADYFLQPSSIISARYGNPDGCAERTVGRGWQTPLYFHEHDIVEHWPSQRRELANNVENIETFVRCTGSKQIVSASQNRSYISWEQQCTTQREKQHHQLKTAQANLKAIRARPRRQAPGKRTAHLGQWWRGRPGRRCSSGAGGEPRGVAAGRECRLHGPRCDHCRPLEPPVDLPQQCPAY